MFSSGKLISYELQPSGKQNKAILKMSKMFTRTESSIHCISPVLIVGNLSRFHRKENLLRLFRCYRPPLTFAVTNNGESDAKVAPPSRGLSPGGSGPLPPIHYSHPPSTLSQNCQNPFLVTSSDLQTICAQLFDSNLYL